MITEPGLSNTNYETEEQELSALCERLKLTYEERAVLKDFIERFPQDAIKRQATERLKQIENEIDSNTSSGNATKK